MNNRNTTAPNTKAIRASAPRISWLPQVDREWERVYIILTKE